MFGAGKGMTGEEETILALNEMDFTSDLLKSGRSSVLLGPPSMENPLKAPRALWCLSMGGKNPNPV